MEGKPGSSAMLWLTSIAQLTSAAAMLPLTLAASVIRVTGIVSMLPYTLLVHGKSPTGDSPSSSPTANDQHGGRHVHFVADRSKSKEDRPFSVSQQLRRMGMFVWSVPRSVLAGACSVTHRGLSIAVKPVVVPARAVWSTTAATASMVAGYVWPGSQEQLEVREAKPEEMETVLEMLENDRAKLQLPAQMHLLWSPGSVAAMFLIGAIVNSLLRSELVAILVAFPIWIGVVQAKLCWHWTREQERRDTEGRLCRYLVAVYKNRLQGVVRLASLADGVPLIQEIAWEENVRFDLPGELLKSVQSYSSSKGEVKATLCELETDKLEMLTSHGFRLTRKWAALDIFPGIELENCDMVRESTP